jgi:hypothetical protein
MKSQITIHCAIHGAPQGWLAGKSEIRNPKSEIDFRVGKPGVVTWA